MARSRAHVGRALLLLALAVTLLLLTATAAFAAPKVNYVKFTNPVAYDLKSL